MYELPFGARICDSLVEMLKRSSAEATADWPGVLPRLCVEEERSCYERAPCAQQKEKPINFEKPLESVEINRLVPPERPHIVITERIWVVYFDNRRYKPRETFYLDGLEVHINEESQAALKGATLSLVAGKIVATYEPT